MSYSQDGSQRDFINSIDSANKITAKQFIKTQISLADASRLKIAPEDENQKTLQNQSSSDLSNKQIPILNSTGRNIIQEKTKFQILCESLLYGISNFCLIYYIVLLILGVYYNVNGLYNQIFLGLQIILGFLISFFDAYMNKLQLYESIELANQQQYFTFISDNFKESQIGELRPGNIVKLSPGQKCPADGFIIGTTGVSENVQLKEISGLTIQRRAAISNLTFGKSIEGVIDVSDEKKARMSVKMETSQFQLELQSQHKIIIFQSNNSADDIFILITGSTLFELKADQESSYEKTTIDPKLGFSLHMQSLITVMINFLLAIVLLVCYFIQPSQPYLETGETKGLFETYVEYLCTLSWGIPTMQLPFISLINRISKSKAEKDHLLDPDLSGKLIKIANSNALANMARAKYILTDLQLLTRQSIKVNNIFLNKSSDEINLNNLVTVTPIEDIEDIKLSQSEIRFALLAFQTEGKTQEDIAIQNEIMEHGLIIGLNAHSRTIQDQEQNQQQFVRMFELIQPQYQLYGYELIAQQETKQFFLVYRAPYKDCKEWLDQSLQLQLRDSVDIPDNLPNLIVILKKLVPKQYIERIEKVINTNKTLDSETLKQIRTELEPSLFIELDQDFYDCSQEILDIRNCEYKIWINSHIKDPSVLENDPTIAGLLKQTTVTTIISQHADELQVALEQFEMNHQTKIVGKEKSFYSDDKPVMLIIDDHTMQIGLKNELLQEKFKETFLKIPIVLLLNSKPPLNYLLMPIVKSCELICVTKYVTATASMQISIGTVNETAFDIQLPHFSFLPKILIVHGRLINIRQQLTISFINYTSFIIFFVQFIYTCYNRFSCRYLFNEFIHFMLGLFTLLYGLIHLGMTQDFNFEVLQNQPVYHQMVRVTKNPYRMLAIEFSQACFHAAFVVISTVVVFYGSNDQNGYVHGIYLQQFISLCILLTIIAFKPMLEQYKIVKFQLYLAIMYLATTILLIQKSNGIMKDLFETGIKTKDLCALVFLPICGLSPILIGKFGQRLLSSNTLNFSLNKMEILYDESVENQRLRDAKNYIKMVQKEELEIEEDIVNSKKVL